MNETEWVPYFWPFSVSFGMYLFIPAVILICLYTAVLTIFLTDKEFRGNQAFMILTHIGIADIGQLLMHVSSSYTLIFKRYPPFWLAKVFGSFMFAFWVLSMMLVHYLNFNRFTTFMLQKYSRIWKNNFFVYFPLFVCYSVFLLSFVLHLLPDCDYIFDAAYFYWGSIIEPAPPLAAVMVFCEHQLHLSVIISSFVTYTAIIGKMCFLGASSSNKRERIITLQALVVVGSFTASYIHWKYIVATFWVYGIGWDFSALVVWVFMDGIHPILYLIFNTRLRNSVFRSIGIKTKESLTFKSTPISKFSSTSKPAQRNSRKMTHS